MESLFPMKTSVYHHMNVECDFSDSFLCVMNCVTAGPNGVKTLLRISISRQSIRTRSYSSKIPLNTFSRLAHNFKICQSEKHDLFLGSLDNRAKEEHYMTLGNFCEQWCFSYLRKEATVISIVLPFVYHRFAHFTVHLRISSFFSMRIL